MLEKAKTDGFVLLCFPFVLFASSWMWQLYLSGQYFELIVSVAFSIFLYFALGKTKAIAIFLYISTFIIFFSNFQISKSVFYLEELDIYNLNIRRSYYSGDLVGRFAENKPLKFLTNYKQNFFQGIDPNFYFFANHPRERGGISEFEKLSPIFIPLFLIGVIDYLRRRIYQPFYYSLFTLSLISTGGMIDNFSYLLFPFFALSIYHGIYLLCMKFPGIR